jgi:hypothetical protein
MTDTAKDGADRKHSVAIEQSLAATRILVESRGLNDTIETDSKRTLDKLS